MAETLQYDIGLGRRAIFLLCSAYRIVTVSNYLMVEGSLTLAPSH